MGTGMDEQLDDILVDAFHERVYYHVEGNFSDCQGWKRNSVEHETIEDANKMLKAFQKRKKADWQFRVVKVVVTQKVVT